MRCENIEYGGLEGDKVETHAQDHSKAVSRYIIDSANDFLIEKRDAAEKR